MGHENKSMDSATRPSQAMLPLKANCVSDGFRSPADRAEIRRRVAIYTRQVQETGQVTWLPRRGEGERR